MAEWFKAHAWKACVGETLPRVRIPLSPPVSYLFSMIYGLSLATCNDERGSGFADFWPFKIRIASSHFHRFHKDPVRIFIRCVVVKTRISSRVPKIAIAGELLTTLDQLVQKENCPKSVAGIRVGLRKWPTSPQAASRKLQLFSEHYIELALNKLGYARCPNIIWLDILHEIEVV